MLVCTLIPCLSSVVGSNSAEQQCHTIRHCTVTQMHLRPETRKRQKLWRKSLMWEFEWGREGVSEDLKRIAVGRDSPDPKCTLGGGLRRWRWWRSCCMRSRRRSRWGGLATHYVRRRRGRRGRRGRCKIGKIFIVRLSAQNINGSFSMDRVCLTFSWITLPRGRLNVRLTVLAFENSYEWRSVILNAHAANMDK